MIAIHKEEYNGLTINIYQDEHIEGPRKEFDNFGHMICFHRRYNLGDKHNMTTEELIELIKDPNIIALPLYLLDHSGLWMRTKRFIEDSCGWDTSKVGYIYCNKEDIRKNWSIKKVTAKYRQKAIDLLEAEVNQYSQYLEGDVWGFEISDPSGQDVNSCWGYYGLNYCIQEAKSAVDEQFAGITTQKSIIESINKEAQV